MIDLTKIALSVIGLVSALLTTFLIPYLRQKLSSARLEEIRIWVNIAVKAAEMLYVGSGRGEEKKEYVLNFLNSKGYTIDAESVENMVEAAVLEMKNAAGL